MTREEALALPRVAICGGPRVGKTTISNESGRADVTHTDDFIDAFRGLERRAIADTLCAALANEKTFLLEGVWAAHALRAGLKVDCAIWLDEAKVERTPGQETMAKGVQTVFDEWALADGGTTPILAL